MNYSLPVPPHQPYQNVKLDECYICLETLHGEIGEVSCGHIFHLKCLSEWINKKGAHRACCICEKNTEIVNIIDFPKPKNVYVTENNNNREIIENRENEIILPENIIKKYRCCQIL